MNLRNRSPSGATSCLFLAVLQGWHQLGCWETLNRIRKIAFPGLLPLPEDRGGILQKEQDGRSPGSQAGGAPGARPWLRVGGLTSPRGSCLVVMPAPLKTTRKPSVRCGKLSGGVGRGPLCCVVKYLLANKPVRMFKSVGHLLSGNKRALKILDKDPRQSSERVCGSLSLGHGPHFCAQRKEGRNLSGHLMHRNHGPCGVCPALVPTRPSCCDGDPFLVVTKSFLQDGSRCVRTGSCQPHHAGSSRSDQVC